MSTISEDILNWQKTNGNGSIDYCHYSSGVISFPSDYARSLGLLACHPGGFCPIQALLIAFNIPTLKNPFIRQIKFQIAGDTRVKDERGKSRHSSLPNPL